MTIESITGRTQPPPNIGPSSKTAIDSGKAAPTNSAGKNDSIAITAMAQSLKQAFASSSSDAIIDANRVSAVKTALANGSYQINAAKIAQKMIQYEQLMP